MRRLLDAWWEVLSHPDASGSDLDAVSAILIILGMLALGVGMAAIIGGGSGQ